MKSSREFAERTLTKLSGVRSIEEHQATLEYAVNEHTEELRKEVCGLRAELEVYGRFAEKFGDLSGCYDAEDATRVIQRKYDAMNLIADDHAIGRVQNSERYTADRERYQGAIEMFENRRKLAHSLRAESPQVAAFVEAIGVEMDKILSGDCPRSKCPGRVKRYE